MTIVEIGGRKHLKRDFKDWEWGAWLKFPKEVIEIYNGYRKMKPEEMFTKTPRTKLGQFLASIGYAYLRCRWAMIIVF